MKTEYSQILQEFVLKALAEDVGPGDYTSLSTIPLGKNGFAKLIIKDEGVLAGIEEALEVLRQVDSELSVEIFLKDGDQVKYGDVGMEISGSIHSILKAERLLLNIMQRMSGIATETYKITSLLKGTKTKVLDTRKTTPLLRFLEKKAVVIGGGVNHRFGLYDMILIKDNHVDYAGGILEALTAANSYRKDHNLDIDIEIEVRNLKELHEVLNFGSVERIMLDNFTPDQVKEAVSIIDGRLITEASGGINIQTARAYAEAGVDFISIGGLTHSVKSLDISLKAKLVNS